MNPKLLRIFAPLVALCFVQLACYNSYRISDSELQNLTSSHIAASAEVQTDEGPVTVRAQTPIEVISTTGRHNVSPFNFSYDANGLVAPDYDLYLQSDEVEGARVFEFAKGRTIGLIVGAIVVAGGSFAAVSLLADSESQ